MSTRQMRDYQSAILVDVEALARAGKRRILIQGPTGMGKGVIFAELIRRAVSKDKKVIFVAHRRELIHQISVHLDALVIDHGVWMANHWRWRPSLPVQVCSVKTLARRSSSPPADLVLIDEAHHVSSGEFRQVVSAYPEGLIIGTTATPMRLDGQGLDDVFEAMVCGPSVAELVEQGYLLPFRVYRPETPDLVGVSVNGGDYTRRRLEIAVRKNPQRVGRIIEEWKEKGEGRQTVCFAVTIEDSRDIARRFCEAGIPAEHADGDMSPTDRDAVLARLRSGRTRVVTNVGLWTEGVDVPVLSCVILARPTLSLSLYLQQVGRAARPFEGQTYAVLLDHAGCCYQHGLPDHPHKWSLSGAEKRGQALGESMPTIACDVCGTIRDARQLRCEACIGVQIAVFGGLPVEAEGKLVLAPNSFTCGRCRSDNLKVSAHDNDLHVRVECRDCGYRDFQTDAVAAGHASEDRRRREYVRLEQVRLKKGLPHGWPAQQYKRIFGSWPPTSWRGVTHLSAKPHAS